MKNENGFDLIISVIFAMSLQLGELVTKAQELVISFRLGERETIPQFYLKAL